MLATLAALHLLVLTQAPAANAPSPSGTAEAPQGANPPLPRRPQRNELPPTSAPSQPGEFPPSAEPAPQPPAQPTPPGRLEPAPILTTPSQVSLLGAESLHGGSALLAEVGWSSIGVLYGQGITRTDDLGGLATFDWATTELRLGGFYRRPLGAAGAFDVAGRLALAWYADLGKDWVYSDNHRDRGVELSPALVLSSHAAGGIFSMTGEAPITVTVRRGSGLLFSPRVSVAYEVPLYGDYTVGARGGLGYRGGSGDAPLKDGRGELTFLLVGGFRIF
jgi:hypothetical protein